MLELVQAGGWLMYPILLCSIIAAGIVAERLWTLQTKKVIPKKLMTGIWNLLDKDKMTEKHVIEIEQGSPLGRVLAAGLINRHLSRDLVRESIEETGRFVTHELEKFLNTLGTISTVTPLLGLLGTVIGMIKVFTAITTVGVGDPTVLAGGISEALITTATGLSVAIPSLIFYRYLKRKIDELVVGMEQEAMKLVEVLHGERHLSKSNISKSNISKSNVAESNAATKRSVTTKKSATNSGVTKSTATKSTVTKSTATKSNRIS